MICKKIISVKSSNTEGTPAKTVFWQREDGAILIEQKFLVDITETSAFCGDAIVRRRYKDRILFERVVCLKGETFASFLTACIQKGILSTNEKQ